MKKNQNGFGVVEIILVLIVIGVIFTLGWIAYSHYHKQTTLKNNTTQNTSTTVKKDDITSYKTYTTDIYNISFEYPDSWSLSDPVTSNEEGNVSRSVTVNTSNNTKVDFTVGIRGLGGGCDAPSTYEVIDTSVTSVRGQKQVSFSMTLQPNTDGTYEGYYGLTDFYNSLGDIQTCPTTFYYVFSPTNDDYGLIEFNAHRSFTSVSAAKAYVSSEEYRAIKQMTSSLSY